MHCQEMLLQQLLVKSRVGLHPSLLKALQWLLEALEVRSNVSPGALAADVRVAAPSGPLTSLGPLIRKV